MTHEFTLQEMRTYLIVGCNTQAIHETIDAGYGSTTREKAFAHLAKMHAKDNACFFQEPCKIVRAVCDPVADDSRWSCGKTFVQAEANFHKGIFDNWQDF